MNGSRSGGSAAELSGSWRVAVRIARRAAWRNKIRSLLVLMMLAIPVFAGSVLILAWSATYASSEREASWRLGQADIWLDGSGVEQAAATLPLGSKTYRHVVGDTIVLSSGRHAIYEYWGADVDAPINNGKYVLRRGHPPHGADEVAVTASLAASLGLDVGGRVTAGLPLRSLNVTAIVDTADQLNRQALIVPSEHPLSQDGQRYLVVDLPDGSDWKPEGIDGLGYIRRADVQPGITQQAQRAAAFTVVVGFTGVQVGLLVAAAFAVGARRQRRELAMVGAIGATQRQLARMVLANGVVLGAIAGILGVGLGLLLFLSSDRLVERMVNHPLASGIPVWPLAALALLAVAIGVLSAYGPSRSMSRLPIRAAMIGREAAAGKTGGRLLGVSATMAACGVGAALYAARPSVSSVTLAAVGAGLVLVGIAGCAPALVGLAGRLASASPLPQRLAIRHAARHQLRTGAAVAAVCAAMAGSLALMLFYSADTRTGVAAQPIARTGQVLLTAEAAATLQPADVQELQRLLPVRAVVSLHTVPAIAAYVGPITIDQAAPDLPQAVTVGDAAVIRAVTGRDPERPILDALAHGNAIVFYSVFHTNGQVRLRTDDGRTLDLPAVVVPAPDSYSGLPTVLISERTATRYRLAKQPGGLVFDTIRPPSSKELADAQDAVLAAQLRSGSAASIRPIRLVAATNPRSSEQTDPLVYILGFISIFVTIIASGVAVGLATSEMRDDLSTLAAIGGGPRLRRWITASQAGLIVGLGAILGLLAGVAPAAGLVALRPDMTWHMPWALVALVTIGAPLLAVSATALITRSELILTRRFG